MGKDQRFESWEEAASAISGNYGSSFDRYTQDDWVRMAQRNCREENGEIRFDYDMAIAEPFRNAGATPAVDLWPFFTALGAKATAGRPRREERTAERGHRSAMQTVART